MDKERQGSRIAGGNSATGRRAGDFYPTPPEVTSALVDFLKIPNDKIIWECACGSGEMSTVLQAEGYRVISSDVENRGFGNAGVDFLKDEQQENFDWIITNPPFSLAEAFIRRAWDTGKPFALLHKVQFWNAARRIALFEECKPTYVLPLSWRPDFTGCGGALMDMAWSVWTRKPEEETVFCVLKKRGHI